MILVATRATGRGLTARRAEGGTLVTTGAWASYRTRASGAALLVFGYERALGSSLAAATTAAASSLTVVDVDQTTLELQKLLLGVLDGSRNGIGRIVFDLCSALHAKGEEGESSIDD